MQEAISVAQAIIAAGGADRNRGNAEKLRRYWTRGKGALKIRWGQPGDWKRCVRYLSKYLGPRSKGYCQLRHKEALGIYTATHAKRHKKNLSELDMAYLQLSEALFSELENFNTEVTEEDMALDYEVIISESDPDFDGNWEPEEDVVILLSDPENCKEDHEYSTDFAAEEDITDLSPEEIQALKVEKATREKEEAERAKYTPKTQPRDDSGKFRQVLARLKSDLGTAGLDRVISKLEEAELLTDWTQKH
jgi:hypothetical protein